MGDKTEIPEPEPWSAARLNELENLRLLLIDCESLDSANNTIARMKRLIAEAKKLRTWDRSRHSFWHFLEDHARHGYANRRKKKRPLVR